MAYGVLFSDTVPNIDALHTLSRLGASYQVPGPGLPFFCHPVLEERLGCVIFGFKGIGTYHLRLYVI